MSNVFELLALSAPVGKGQENRPDDVARFDNSLRRIGEYDPPLEYADGPQRYATESVIDALDRFQEKNGLKVDGIVNPGGPTERAINNRLLGKPRGVGLMFDPPSAIKNAVGNGMANDARDLTSVKRRLGALQYLPEDPFDAPSSFITGETTDAIKRFQRDNGLVVDGIMRPKGETEDAIGQAVERLATVAMPSWIAFARNPDRYTSESESPQSEPADPVSDDLDGVVLAKSGGPGGPIVPPQGPGQRLGPSSKSFFGVNPNYQPPMTPRSDAPIPRDPEWAPPGARAWPSRPPQRPPERLPQPQRWEPPTPRDIESALRREPIPDLKTAVSYIPEPGSPLSIPLTAFNPHGRPGDPRTQELNRDVAQEIERACREVLGKKADVKHIAGPGSENPGELAVSKKKNGDGRSFPDFETRINYEGFEIRIFGDTYTALSNREPNARERNQFARLEHNTSDYNRIFVRLPKAWQFNEVLDVEKLGEFTRKLCEEVKKAVDEGKLGDGKEKLRLEKLAKNLTKRKKILPEDSD